MADTPILLIERADTGAPTFAAALERAGYRVQVVPSGKQALARARAVEPALVILNAASLKSSGVRICKRLRDELDVTVIHIHREGGLLPADDDCSIHLTLPLMAETLVERVSELVPLSGVRAVVPARKEGLPAPGRLAQALALVIALASIVMLALVLGTYGGADLIAEVVREFSAAPTATQPPLALAPAASPTQASVLTPSATPPPAAAGDAPTEPPPSPTATSTLDPNFDPANPFRFCADGRCVDFLQPEREIVFFTPFIANSTSVVTPVLPISGQAWEEYFPLCGTNILVTNGKDGDSPREVWYKTIIYAHSGRCRGRALVGEFLRGYLEGGYFVPSETQRSQRLEEIKGQVVTMDQGEGPVTFEIVDAVYLDEDVVTDYAADPGSLDRFFPSGEQPGKHEIFLIFCGSIGPLQSANPMDFFTSRYVLRLQVMDGAEVAQP